MHTLTSAVAISCSGSQTLASAGEIRESPTVLQEACSSQCGEWVKAGEVGVNAGGGGGEVAAIEGWL